MPRLFGAGLCFIVVALLGPRAALADDRPLVVMIASRADETGFDRVAAAMVAQFAGSNVRFDVHWITEIPPRLPDQERLAAEVAYDMGAMAVLWVDLEALERVYFYLTAARSENVLVRRLDGTGDEGLADALALMSKSAVDALLEGGVIGVTLPVPIEKEVTKTVQEPGQMALVQDAQDIQVVDDVETGDNPWRKIRVFVDVSYAMSVLSEESGLQNGAYFSVSLLHGDWFRGFLGYTFYQVLEDRNSYAELQLRRNPIQAGVGARLKTGRWSFEAALALVFDYMKRTLKALAEGVTVTDSYVRLGVSLVPAWRVEVQVRGSLSLFTSLGAEIHFVRPQWTLAGGPDFFGDLWPIRPRLLLGGRFDLF